MPSIVASLMIGFGVLGLTGSPERALGMAALFLGVWIFIVQIINGGR